MTHDEVHDRARYRRGCRCDQCRAANRAYQRNHRAKRLRSIPDVEGETPTDPTAVTVAQAVQAELQSFGTALAERPGLAAIALGMARVLDNPLALPQQPAAAGRLMEVLAVLSKRSNRRGKLAVVKAMTSTNEAG